VEDEAILAGGSSGAAVAALEKVRDTIPAGSHCVLVFPDGGDRYLDTIYSDAWVEQQFGEVGHLWKRLETTEAARC
jgi:cysteine synthase A